MDDHRDDRYDDTELEEQKSAEPGKTEEKKDDSSSDYEDVCFICRRPESKKSEAKRS